MARLGVTPDDMVFSFIGTFATYEGLPDLAQAAAMLRDRGYRFKLLMVGDGPHFAPVAEYVAQHGLGDVVIMTGRVPFTDVPDYYSITDIAVFPRTPLPVTEMVSPLKPFEAMAMGKLVISSDVAALAEIVRHGETGLTFRMGSVAALADVMAEALDDPARAARIAAVGREWTLRERTWDATAAKVADAWAELGLVLGSTTGRRSRPRSAPRPGAEAARQRPESSPIASTITLLRNWPGFSRANGLWGTRNTTTSARSCASSIPTSATLGNVASSGGSASTIGSHTRICVSDSRASSSTISSAGLSRRSSTSALYAIP
ncbi:MAG: glycosyltransferase family 4 protein [Sphingomonas sp.]